MIIADDFLNLCLEFGLKTFTGTPCSYLKPFINRIIENENINFFPSTNEGDAIGFASGAWLGGESSVVVFQNSGLGNAVNPITSLSQISKIPFLGIVTLRGEPGGASDEPQHDLMGAITTDLLSLMKIPWSYFPTSKEELKPALEKANSLMLKERTPYFFVMRKDTVKEYKLSKKSTRQSKILMAIVEDRRTLSSNLITRHDALDVAHRIFKDQVPLFATTGKTGRELYEIEDSSRNFYMVGSMGCALSLGQGYTTITNRPTCVIDGDGALMMRMGSMATTGILGKRPLFHLVLDNCAHDSTGGQNTGSDKISLATIAAGCGYERVICIDNAIELEKSILEFQLAPQLTFVHMIIEMGSSANLGRPGIHPHQVAERFRKTMSRSL